MENHRMLGTPEAAAGGIKGGPGPIGVRPTAAAAKGAGVSGPRAGVGQQRLNPTVLEKPVRPRFSAEYKARMLPEVEVWINPPENRPTVRTLERPRDTKFVPLVSQRHRLVPRAERETCDN